jgi:hypothetical protein
MPGRCAIGDGDGWLIDGDVGVVGPAGDDGRAGAEYVRDPRLPPPRARAHASVTWPTTTIATVSAAIETRIRCFIVYALLIEF